MLGVIRIRGRMNLRREVEDTLRMLGLKKRYWFTTIDEDNKALMGMFNKIRDYVTFGEIDEETAKKILGDLKSKGLHPPRKGFKFKTNKSGKRGELGKRDDIKELLERMK